MGGVSFSNSFQAMKEVLSGSFTEKFRGVCRKYREYRLPVLKEEDCKNYVEAMKKLNRYLLVLKQNREDLKRLENAIKLADKGENVSKSDKDLIAGRIGVTLGWGFLRNSVRDRFKDSILLPIIAIEEKLRDAYDEVWPRRKVGEITKKLEYATYPCGIVRAIMNVLYDD